jgi:hypothetical protein
MTGALSPEHCHPSIVTRALSPEHCHPSIVTQALSPEHCHPSIVTRVTVTFSPILISIDENNGNQTRAINPHTRGEFF